MPAAIRPRTGSTARRPRAHRGSTCSRCCLLSDSFARRLEPGKRTELVVRQPLLELGERLPRLAAVQPAAHEPLHGGLDPLARDAAEKRSTDRGGRTERAADEDVVRTDPVA